MIMRDRDCRVIWIDAGGAAAAGVLIFVLVFIAYIFAHDVLMYRASAMTVLKHVWYNTTHIAETFTRAMHLHAASVAYVVALFTASLCAALTFVAASRIRQCPRIIRGRIVSDNFSALQRAEHVTRKTAGLRLHEQYTISKKTEEGSIFFIGAPGSGKTQILGRLILQLLLRRRVKVLLYDVKGDFTAWLGWLSRVKLVAPWDARSVAWDVSADVTTKVDAETLAKRLVPDREGEGSMWSAGAQQILTAIIVNLQNTKPRRWSFTDITDVVKSTYAQMRKFALAGDISVQNHLPPEVDRTTKSFLVNMTSFMSQVFFRVYAD